MRPSSVYLNDTAFAPDEIEYTMHIRGDSTPEQFQRVHKNDEGHSRNYWNMASPVALQPKLDVDPWIST